MELLKPNNIETKKAMHVMYDLKDDLSMSSRFLYFTLMAIGEYQKITQDELTEITNLSMVTIIRSIRELKDHNLIVVKRSQRGAFYKVL